MLDPRVYQTHILSCVPTRMSLQMFFHIRSQVTTLPGLNENLLHAFQVCSSILLPTPHQSRYHPGLGFWGWRIPLLILLLHARLLQSGPTLCNPMDFSPPGLCARDSPGKNTGVGCHALLQGIFPTQGSNLCLPCLLHWQVGSYH